MNAAACICDQIQRGWIALHASCFWLREHPLACALVLAIASRAFHHAPIH